MLLLWMLDQPSTIRSCFCVLSYHNSDALTCNEVKQVFSNSNVSPYRRQMSESTRTLLNKLEQTINQTTTLQLANKMTLQQQQHTEHNKSHITASNVSNFQLPLATASHWLLSCKRACRKKVFSVCQFAPTNDRFSNEHRFLECSGTQGSNSSGARGGGERTYNSGTQG